MNRLCYLLFNLFFSEIHSLVSSDYGQELRDNRTVKIINYGTDFVFFFFLTSDEDFSFFQIVFFSIFDSRLNSEILFFFFFSLLWHEHNCFLLF